MNMKLNLLLLFSFIALISIGQNENRLKELNNRVNTASSDVGKVEALGMLADYYQLYKLDKKADSVLAEQIFVAESSSDKNLLLEALFNPTIVNIGSGTTTATYDRAIALLLKSLEYAESSQRPDFSALAYTRLAGIYRKRGKYEEAHKQINLAYSTYDESMQDSVSLLLHLEAGDIYKSQGDALPAYKNFSKALDISYKINNYNLRSETYYRISDLYRDLHDTVSAEKQIFKSIELNKKIKNYAGLCKDYYYLARLTDKKEYIEKGLSLAKEIHSEKYLFQGKRLMYIWNMLYSGNGEQIKKFFHNNNDLIQFFSNQGIEIYYWNIGNIYKYSKEFDSSLYYFKLVATELEKSYDDNTKVSIYQDIGDSYLGAKNLDSAAKYYSKAYDFVKQKNFTLSLLKLTDSLRNIFVKQKKYEQVYFLTLESEKYKDAINDKAAKDKLMLLSLETEEKEREREENLRHNIQYTSITIVLAGIFMLLLLLGMFPVTELTIKLFGFLAFVSLFEFFVLLIDTFLHHLTHGEPIWIWVCKVGIIAAMVPFQHYLEQKMVKYLVTRKLIDVRKNFFFKTINSMKGNKTTSDTPQNDDLTQDEKKNDPSISGPQ